MRFSMYADRSLGYLAISNLMEQALTLPDLDGYTHTYHIS
jgi:hypothetical protein